MRLDDNGMRNEFQFGFDIDGESLEICGAAEQRKQLTVLHDSPVVA